MDIISILQFLNMHFSWWQSLICLFVGSALSLAGTFLKKRFAKNRTCTDCITMAITESIKCQNEIFNLKNNLIRDQLNFTKQKLLEMGLRIEGDYIRNPLIIESEKVKEYKFFSVAIKLSLNSVRDEIERSFRENGFSSLREPSVFDKYCENKYTQILDITQQMMSYLFSTPYDIIGTANKNDKYYYTIVYEIFDNARKLSFKADDMIKQSKDELEEFIRNMGLKIKKI